MFRSCFPQRELQTSIHIGRVQLAQQFATMDGWQSQQDSRFDDYIREKRRKETFDAFDQRVERAYRSAAALHKAEVMNSVKRKLASTKEKFTPQVMLETKAAVEERLRWLRDVWSQIDADYRSGDQARAEQAAKEISAALQGEPGDYMRWVYERKYEERFAGPKQLAASAAELENAELPDVSEEEVSRYHSLAVDMMQIEREVKSKYGIAGQQHWAELQAAKDTIYEQKLDRAAKIYQELLKQSANYDESRRTALLRSNVERVHQAQVRFKAAMEMESERERMIEAHNAMEAERAKNEKERRIALLNEAAAMRERGATTEEVTAAMRERQLESHAQRQAEDQLRAQEAIRAKKAAYVDVIERFKADVEEREGRELLQRRSNYASDGRDAHERDTAFTDDRGQRLPLQPQRIRAAPSVSAFGFAEEDRLEESIAASDALFTAADADAAVAAATEVSPAASSSPSKLLPRRSPHTRIKQALWDDIADDHYEDPFHTVHQARLDAAKSYDPAYAKFFPMNTVQGRKYSKQNMGEFAAGNAMDNQIMQRANMNTQNLAWGVKPYTAFQLDGDGENAYFLHTTWHARDAETGDIDYRYERRKGGAVFRGPRLYNIGAARDAADPGERTMDPMPYQPSSPRRMRVSARSGSSNYSDSASDRGGGRGNVGQQRQAPSTSQRASLPRSVRLQRVASRTSAEAATPAIGFSDDWRSA